MNNISANIRYNAQRRGYAGIWCRCGKYFDNRGRFEKHLQAFSHPDGTTSHGICSMIEARFNADWEREMLR